MSNQELKELIEQFGNLREQDMLLAIVLKNLKEIMDRLEKVEKRLEMITIAEDKLTYKPKEAAKLFGVHHHTILKWLKEGKIGYLEGTKMITMGEIKRVLKDKMRRDHLDFFKE